MTVAPRAVEILPLHTIDEVDVLQQHLLVCDASSLLHSSSNLSNGGGSNDGGDVLAYIQDGSHCDNDDSNSKRKVIVQRMDGTHIASFDLPSNNNDITATPPTAGSNQNRYLRSTNNNSNINSIDEQILSSSSSPSSEWDEGYRNQILCWASFRKHHRRRYNGSSGGRKMLCVLGNPNTLFVFDVLGDTAILATTAANSYDNDSSSNSNSTAAATAFSSSNRNNNCSSLQEKRNCNLRNNNNFDDDDAGGGPGGHTISLPFHAQSIYPVPNGCGLLVVRTPANEDYVANTVLQQQQWEEAQSTTTPITNTAIGDTVRQNNIWECGGKTPSSSSLRGGGGEELDVPPPPPTTPSALGMSLPATPKRGQAIQTQYQNEEDDELSLDYVDDPPDPLRFVASSSNINGAAAAAVTVGLLPCLFSLRHPLDEIRPVAIASTTAAASHLDEDDKVNDNLAVEPESEIIGNQQQQKLDLFTDVNETLVHVISPRLFHHYPNNFFNNNSGVVTTATATTTSPMICVTYNQTLSRHTIWTLSESRSVVEDIPLWKSTGRGAWRGGEQQDEQWAQQRQKHGTTAEFNNEKNDDDYDDADAVLVGVQHNEEEIMQTSLIGSSSGSSSTSRGVAALAPSFSDIHPDFTLTRVFVEDRNDPMDEEFEVDEEDLGADLRATITTKSTREKISSSPLSRYQRNLFFATDQGGNGDLILCIFMPNESNKQQQDKLLESSNAVEPAILRCYSLHLSSASLTKENDDENDKNDDAPLTLVDSVSHVMDVACSSAQPIQAIPTTLKPFARKSDDKVVRTSSRSQKIDVNTLARDILVVQNCSDEKTGGSVVESSRRLRLFRAGTIHIVDFSLPKSMIQSQKMEGFHYGGLDNAVGNRVDIKLVKAEEVDKKQVITTKIVRSEISLVVHASPVTETALCAIESALVSSKGGGESATLPLLIRADCARLLQQMWSSSDNANGDGTNIPSGVEDIAWYTLSVILLRLLLPRSVSNQQRQTSEVDSCELSVWEELLQSDFHITFSQGEGRLLFGDSCPGDDGILRNDACGVLEQYDDELSSLEFAEKTVKGGACLDVEKCIFDSLHLVHEDSRLVKSRGVSWTRRLGSLLLHVSEQMTPLMMDFEDHYQRCLGDTRCFSTVGTTSGVPPPEKRCRLSSFTIPPCIMTWVDSMLQHDLVSPEEMKFGTVGYSDMVELGLNGACSTSWMVIRLFSTLFAKNVISQHLRDRETVITMLDEGVYHPIQLQEELPISISLILLETIRRCRVDPPQIDSSNFCWSCAAYDLVGRNDLAELLAQSLCTGKRDSESSFSYEGSDAQVGQASSNDPDRDGLAALEDFSCMLFPDDNRIKEAARLLRSSRPLFLRVPRPVELSDHEYERSKQDKLLLLCRRSIATPLGRGMLTLGTHRLLSSDQLLIPDIVLAGRIPPTNNNLALDMSRCPPNFRIWPEFHNGVAAGLRLPEASSDGGKIITRTWIKFNRPASQNSSGTNQNPPSYAHGGFLMALGLRGHLSVLNTSDLTDYLSQGTTTTTVGIFLGMAANKRGSCDPGVSKMLCLHVPSLLPPSFTPMDLASTVQAAAVAGIGLLYQKSSHRLMTEFLLNEIGRPPTKDQNTNDRESFALVCGLSLGLINLQKGKSTVGGLEDLKIEERLHRYISGVGAENEFQSSPSPFQNGHQAEGDRNARIHESDFLNRDITAPGAILALGLMYIKSGNVSFASIVKLPDTHFLLDYIRPDLLALRVLAKSLILWNVEPTPAWIDSQVPSVVKNSIEFMRKAAIRAVSLGLLDEEMDGGDEQKQNQSKSDIADFDPQAVRQANAFIIAGACFSIGIRYSGSANREAAAAIFQRVLWFLELRDNKDVTSQVQRPDITSLTTCLCTSAISLAMVMAGTGDLDSFRLLRALRWGCDDSVSYGTHMIYGAAIGLLFLGGGKRTLGSSPEDVAMLIAAFFPHYPISSSDNQYHLQALRHMYVLASHNRILESVDVDSREKVCIPIELALPQSNFCVQSSTPFLVANDSDFVELRTKSDRYYPIVLKTTDWGTRGIMSHIFVKKKPGHISYLLDPNAIRSLSIQAGSASSESFLKSIKMMSSDDSVLLSFAKYFCKAGNNEGSYPEMLPEASSDFLRYCNLIANKCMQEEKSDVLPLYLTLFRWMNSVNGQSVSSIWDLRVLRTYMRRKGGVVHGDLNSVNLVSEELVALVCEHVDSILSDGIDESTLSLPAEKVWYEMPLHLVTPDHH